MKNLLNPDMMNNYNKDLHISSDFDLKSYLEKQRKIIDFELDKILVKSPDIDGITEAMRYSLMAGGKRLRPVLCLASCKVVGCTKNKDVIKAACALEMIHTYSLVHDDLPAMDNDDLRRGKSTCHIAFDEATAILAGDALLTLAFQILSSAAFSYEKNKKEKHALKWLNIIHAVSSAAGYKGMIGGQIRDIMSEGKILSVYDLENMHNLKTGALIRASVYSGASLGNGSREQIEQLNIYAKNIGLAFQITDDILNVEGDPLLMGKAVGTDEIMTKSTYPAIIGLDESKKLADKLVNNAINALESFDENSKPLHAIARYIIERKR